jgi:hypothetical protein
MGYQWSASREAQRQSANLPAGTLRDTHEIQLQNPVIVSNQSRPSVRDSHLRCQIEVEESKGQFIVSPIPRWCLDSKDVEFAGHFAYSVF